MSDNSNTEKLINDLEAMGFGQGDHVALGVSLKALGLGKQAATTLLDSLLSVVGPNGTLIVPAFTRTCSHSEWLLNNSPVFDQKNSPAYTGQFSEFMRSQPQAFRSSHPTNSIVALGAAAEQVTQSHTKSTPAYSCYSTLADLGGKSLSIGIGDSFVGLRHEAQFLAGLLTVFHQSIGCGIAGVGDQNEWFERAETSGCVTKLPLLVKEMRGQGKVMDGSLLDASSCAVAVPEALSFMTARLKESPATYLCSNGRCLWCRETERILGIGDRKLLFESDSNGVKKYIPTGLRSMYIDSRNKLELSDSRLVARIRAIKAKRR